MVEREFSHGPGIRRGRQLASCEDAERNRDLGITWLHSYVSEDGKKTFCVYDGPSPEAIRKAAARDHLPVDRITQVRVLDPYFYP
jgi:hypothetical protein